MQKQPSFYFRIFLLLIWLILIYVGVEHHVFWRDEVRALSISQEAANMPHLLELLKNEGHPPLWYALLHWGDLILKSNIILPIIAISFAVINAVLIAFKSPFHWSLVALILFGQYGLYEYGIIARNYGLAATFLLGFAISAKKGLKWTPYIFLSLAAMSNFYALVFSCILGFFYLLQEFKTLKNKIAPFLLLLTISVLCIALIMPTEESLVVSEFKSIPWHKLWDVGWGFNHLFEGMFHFKHGFKTVVLIGITMIFWRKWKWMICAYLGMLFMSTFHLVVRENFSHHEGMFYFFMIALVWWKWELIVKQFQTKSAVPMVGFTALLLMLTFNLTRGVRNFELYYNLDQSNADHLGEWVKKNASRKTILIGEPDYDMESVVYYYPHAFYIPRENRTRKFALFTTANQSKLTLGRLIHLADSFKAIGNDPYLITQWNLDLWKDTTHKYSYNKKFTVSPEMHMRFKLEFKRDTHFHEFISTDESYYVYSHKE